MASSKKANTAADTNKTTATTHWPPHPVSLLFPLMTTEERTELRNDMLERAERGLDPLEHPIILYESQILDGRHRDEIWMELAEAGACGGFFERNRPPTDTFSPTKHGTLVAWMRAKSANMIHRHIPADQKAAIFLKAVDTIPELKAALDQIKEANAQRQKEGQPLGAGVQRGNTSEQIADLAGVGATTVKQVAKIKKEHPEKFEEVVHGKTTAKKAMRKLGQKRKPEDATATESSLKKHTPFKPGDKIYVVDSPLRFVGTPEIIEYTIKSITDANYVPTSGGTISPGPHILGDLETAKKKWTAMIEKLIGEFQKALKKGPSIVRRK